MNTRKAEKLAKGFANHRRVQILELLEQRPGLSVFDVTDELGVNFRTVSEHLRRLFNAGLVAKKNSGPRVEHVSTEAGKKVLRFLRTFE